MLRDLRSISDADPDAQLWALARPTPYLRAVERQLETLPSNQQRDRDWMLTVQEVAREYEQLRQEVPAGEGLRRIRWMIEELRVSYFAQGLGTAHPVSEQRIHRAMDELTG